MAGNRNSGGRNKLPVEAKAKRGIASVSELALVQDTIQAQSFGVPNQLRVLVAGGAGDLLWHQLWSSSASWLRPDTDIELVQMLCESTEEYVSLRQQVITGGDYADRVALRALEKQRFSLLCALGLSPVDRARLGVAAVKVETQMEMFRKSVNAKRTAKA